jgi:hypothetical protein
MTTALNGKRLVQETTVSSSIVAFSIIAQLTELQTGTQVKAIPLLAWTGL